MGVLNKLKSRMSGYNALTRGPMKDGPGEIAEVAEVGENKSTGVDLKKAKERVVELPAVENTDRMDKTDVKISEAKESGKKGSFWSSYETKEDRLKDRKKRQVGRQERKQIRKDAKEGKINKEEKREKIKASRKKQKPTGKQKESIFKKKAD